MSTTRLSSLIEKAGDITRIDVNALRQERAALRDQANEILNLAELSNTDLTKRDQARFDDLAAEVDEMTRTIDAVASAQQAEYREGLADPPGAHTFGGEASRHQPGLQVRLDDGRQVRAVAAGESFARAVGGSTTQQPGEAPNLLGRMVLEYATGSQYLTDGERANMGIGGPAQGGGYLIGEEVSAQLIDLLRNESILNSAGAMFMPLSNYETRLVRITGDPTASWRAEHEEVASTDLTLGSVTMRPRSIAAMVTLSDELAEDAPNAPQAVETALARASASQLDGRLFRGGTEVPSQMGQGVLDTDGIGVVATLDGAAPSDYDPWLDALELVETANVTPRIRIDAPRTKSQLARLKIGESDNRQLPAPAEVSALTHILSNAVPTNLGAGSNRAVSVVGDFGARGAMVIVGVRSGFRLEGTRVGAGSFEKLQVKIRISGRYDIAVIRPAGLAKVTEIGPTT